MAGVKLKYRNCLLVPIGFFVLNELVNGTFYEISLSLGVSLPGITLQSRPACKDGKQPGEKAPGSILSRYLLLRSTSYWVGGLEFALTRAKRVARC